MGEGPRIPRLAPGRNPAELRLSPAEGFLLSRIDGATSWELLREIGGLAPDDVERCLERWLSEGVVVIEGAAPAPPAEPPPAVAAEAAPKGEDLAALDPGLDLSPELQRSILHFEQGLCRPYHEILDVAPDADPREIKRAYFRLSKQFHPDRYYRRQIGDFGSRLQRIFRKLVEAYELLSDPATRAEVLRSLDATPGPAVPEAAPAAPLARAVRSDRDRKLAFLKRVRQRVRVPEKVLAERRFRASQLYEAGMSAARRAQWHEAAASIRLAIAFDPWSDAYKDGFAEVQIEVHKLRADDLLAQANATVGAEGREEALRLYEEVLHYRPGDVEVLRSAVRVALQSGDLERAREHAESACEVEPDRPESYLLLARVLRRTGLRAKATQALQKALRLDSGNREARAALAELRQAPR